MPDSEDRIIRQTAKQIVASILAASEEDNIPSVFIQKCWEMYKADFPSNNTINGKVFEEFIAVALVKSGISPVHTQAKIAFLPGVNYDIIIYTEEYGPIAVSAKTSLRERWKQADLEALALKNIHRNSKSFVISMDEVEVARREADRESVIALERFILGSSEDFDLLIEELKELTIIDPPTVDAVISSTVVDDETYSE